MKASRKLNRRSFFGTVLGGAMAGGGATMLVTGRAQAQNTRYSGVTDSDTGGNADRPGYGVGTRNRYTDQDTGPNADRQFEGRGPNARPDGSTSGTGNYGEYARPCSDSDGGPGADPGGRGVRCNGQTPQRRNDTPTHTRHCTDSDRGVGADPVQQGRRC